MCLYHLVQRGMTNLEMVDYWDVLSRSMFLMGMIENDAPRREEKEVEHERMGEDRV
jgi:hypothetical protein